MNNFITAISTLDHGLVLYKSVTELTTVANPRFVQYTMKNSKIILS